MKLSPCDIQCKDEQKVDDHISKVFGKQCQDRNDELRSSQTLEQESAFFDLVVWRLKRFRAPTHRILNRKYLLYSHDYS